MLSKTNLSICMCIPTHIHYYLTHTHSILTLYFELLDRDCPSLLQDSCVEGEPSKDTLNFALWPPSTNCLRGLMTNSGALSCSGFFTSGDGNRLQ